MILLNDLVAPLNRVVVGLLRSPLHPVASKGLMVLGWSGRKSGRRFTIPVGYQRDGDDIVVLLSKPAEKSWWKNFRTPWPARLHVQGRTLEATGRWIAPDSDAFYTPIETTLRRLPWMGSQFGGIALGGDGRLSEADRRTACEKVGVVRFETTR